MPGTSHGGIRVPLPGSGFMVTYASQGERERTLRLAEARQQIAHEGNGNPAWQELTEDERGTSELSARNWLRAAQRAGLLAEQDQADELIAHRRGTQNIAGRFSELAETALRMREADSSRVLVTLLYRLAAQPEAGGARVAELAAKTISDYLASEARRAALLGRTTVTHHTTSSTGTTQCGSHDGAVSPYADEVTCPACLAQFAALGALAQDEQGEAWLECERVEYANPPNSAAAPRT
jgi:hypothetical protein